MKPKRTSIFTAALRAAKSKSRRFGTAQLLLGATLVSLVGHQQANAQTDLFWDNADTPTGTWDAAGIDWNTDPGVTLSPANSAWIPGSKANFQQVVGGTVSIVGTQNADTVAVASPGVSNWILNDGGAGLLELTGAGLISSGDADNLDVQVNVNGAAAGQALNLTTGGGSGTVLISGDIGGNIGTVTTDGTITFSGTNTFAGPLNVNSGVLTLNGGSAVTDTAAVSLFGTSQVNLGANETIGDFSGAAGTVFNNAGFDLTVNQAGTTTFQGTLQGGGDLIKEGLGQLTLSGSNTYSGLTLVNAGVLVVANDLGLGAATNAFTDRTTVANGATVALGDGYTSNEFFLLSGTGAAGKLGAMETTGNVTLNGVPFGGNVAIATDGPSTIHSKTVDGITPATLTLNGGILVNTGVADDTITFLTDEFTTIDLNAAIRAQNDGIIKDGKGTLDLSGVDHDYGNIVPAEDVGTRIIDGVVIVDNDNNLGNQSGAATHAVSFAGAAGQTPTLRVIANVDFGDRDFHVNGPLGQFEVLGGFTAKIDNNDLSFASPTNTLSQIGAGTLEIDATDTGVGSTASILGILDAPAGTLTVLGAGFSGLNPAFGPGGVPLPGATTLNLSGLGNAAGGQTGTINLGIAGNEFDNVLIDQSVNTTFDGDLNTTGDLIITGTGNLTLGGAVNVNNIHISGNQLVVDNPASLGDSINSHDQRATFIWGQFNDPLIPDALNTPGQLSLSGGITTSERLTIVNNGILNNLDGNNTVDSEVRIQFNGAMVPPGFTGSDNAQIGATAGQLTLAQGIFSNPGQSVTFNGLASDNGTVNVAGQIQSTVADVVIGNPANTGTVILAANNSFSGNTTINGSNVIVGNAGAFSGGMVTVTSSSTLDSQGGVVEIANNFALTPGTVLTLGGINNFAVGLSGTVSGFGGVTNAGGGNALLGTNTFAGTTTVSSGSLLVSGSINNSIAVNVDGGFLATTGSDKLSDGAVVNVNNGGTLIIGGSETVTTFNVNNGGQASVAGVLTTIGNSIVVANGGTLTVNGAVTNNLNVSGAFTSTADVTTIALNGAATGTIEIGANTLTAQSGTFAGNLNSITPAAGSLVKNGGGTLTLSGNNAGLTGSTTVNGGTLVANNLGSASVNINNAGSTLTASGTFAATTINVGTGTVLNAAGLIANAATVNVNGTVNGAGGANSIAALNINAASGQVNLTGGSLTTGTLNGAGTINLGANTLTAGSGNYGGAINGTGGLTKNTGGTLTLTGTNAYTGATNVNGGTLAVQSSLASTVLNIANGATLSTNAAELLSNAAVVQTNASGTLSLGGNETIATLNGNGSVILGANTLTLNAGGNFSGNIGGTGEIILSGGTLTVSAAGGLNADDLDIKLGTTIITTSANLIGNNTRVNNDGTLQIGGNDTVGTYTSTGTLNGVGTLTAGTYALNGGSVVNASTGAGIMTTNGLVAINSANTGAAQLTVQTGILTAAGTYAAQNIVVDNGAILNSNGIVANNATLAVSGIANVNTAAGTTVNTLAVNAASGIVNINGAGGLTATNVIGGGSINLIGGNLTTVSLNGNSNINLNNNTLTAQNGFQNGSIFGTGNLVKNGVGVLTLAGANGYSGSTAVNAGTLIGGTPLNTSGVTVANNATFINGGLINPNVTISNQGTFTLQGDEQASVYNSNGGLLNGLGTLTAPNYNLSNGASTAVGANLGLGTLTVNGALPVTLNGTANAGIVNINTGNLVLGSAGRLINPVAVVSNFATLTLGGNEAIGTYNSNGGALTGAGTVTAGTYNLSNGATTAANSNLGEGVLNIVDVNPPAGADAAVTLNGLAGADTVNINALTTLNLGSAERLDDTAVVTNRGTLNLNGTETVGTFISSGTLGGAGTLIGTGNTITLQNGHVSLIGTTLQDFGPNPNLTSNGTVNINGANSQVLANNANINVGTAIIQSGTMNLNGLFLNNSGSLTINNGAALVSGFSDRIANGATVVNNGTWTLGGNDTIGAYTSTGTLNVAGFTLTATTYDLNGGSVVNANIGSGLVLSNGTVNLNGTSGAASVYVDSGNLILGSANRLADFANVSVASPGQLTLNGSDTIATLVLGDNTPGTARLAANIASTLTANTFTLNNDSVVDQNVTLGDRAGALSSRLFTNNGNVFLNGVSNVDNVTVNAGSNLIGGANADLNYVLLEGNGLVSLAGGTFTNEAGRTINPGVFDGNQFGRLTINDSFNNLGSLVFDANRQFGAIDGNCELVLGNRDTLAVNGTTTLGGTLNVTKMGGEFARGDKALLIDSAGPVIDNGVAFTSNYVNRNFLVIDNLGGFINNSSFSNTVSLLGTGVAGVNGNLANIAGLNANQIAIANAANTNIAGNGNILDTSVGADLLALAILDCDLDPGTTLNSFSPEAFAGMTDYGIQVTKSYTTAAMSMPGTSIDGSARSVRIPVGYDSAPEPAPSFREASTSVFAGYTHFDTGTDSSINGADYDITSNGAIVGIRHEAGCFTIGGFIGVDQGDISSSFIDADVDGYLLGLVASYLIQPDINLLVTGGVTYGSYEFDGTHSTVLGNNRFSGIDSDVLDIHVAIEGDVYSDDKFRLTPFLGLHYITAETDSFATAGTPAALLVGAQDEDAFFAQIGLKGEYQVNSKFSLNGNLSYTYNFEDSDRKVNASLGGTPFSVSAPGLGEDVFTVGIGAQYQVTEAFRIGANYRAEFSSDAETANGFSLGASYSF